MSATTWKPIPGYVGCYEISDVGTVRSVARWAPAGKGVRWMPSRVLRTARGGRTNQYLRVMLESPKRHAYVHVLVLEAFVGPRPDGHVACHRNDQSHDNRIANLYWGTVDDNVADRIRNEAAADGCEPEPEPEPAGVGGGAWDDEVPF